MLCLLENEHGERLVSTLCFRQEAGGYRLTHVIEVEGRQLALCYSVLPSQLSRLAVGEERLTRLCALAGAEMRKPFKH